VGDVPYDPLVADSISEATNPPPTGWAYLQKLGSDIAETFSQTPDQAAARRAEGAGELKDQAASILPSIPWWVWGSVGLVGLLLLLNELNPTLELLGVLVKRK
jgi:hypothetical protein